MLVRDLETGHEREIFRADAQVNGLALSPDGHQLAFFASRTGSTTAGVIKIISNTGEPVREIDLNNKQFPGFNIAWTHDGRYLVFGTNGESHKIELWRVPVEGGPLHKVGISLENLASLQMNPDGQRIAFSAGEFKSEVWVLEHFLTSEPNTVVGRRLSHRRP